MATTDCPASLPQTSCPLWLGAVDRGKWGRSAYVKEASASISSTRPPRPVPRMMPMRGMACHFALTTPTASWICVNRSAMSSVSSPGPRVPGIADPAVGMSYRRPSSWPASLNRFADAVLEDGLDDFLIVFLAADEGFGEVPR